MTWANYDDVVGQLRAAGLLLQEGEPKIGRAPTSSGIWRCRVVDEGPARRGWYLLHEIVADDGARLLVGSFGVFRATSNESHRVELRRERRAVLTEAQRAAIRARLEADRRAAEAQRRAIADRAARQAARWWAACNEEGMPAYVVKKGLASRHGARVSPAGNLVVPMHDAQRNIRGLQIIYSDPKVRERKGRDKDYSPPGVAKQGTHFTIGALSSGSIVLICEGYATGASLHEATGLPVVVAFDAGNLLPVAEALRKQYRRRIRLLFCADDDYLAICSACKQWTRVDHDGPESGVQHQPAGTGDPPGLDGSRPMRPCERCGSPHGKINTGLIRAREAALATDGGVCVPQWPQERPTNHKGPTDFNDLHVLPTGGLRMVAAQVEASISALGWRFGGVAARGSDNGGRGSTPLKGLLTVDEAAARYALVYAGNGTLFDRLEHALVPKADVLDLLPDHGWREWKGHPERSVVRLSEVGFDPTERDAAITCNLWAGWPTQPGTGSCQMLLDLLRYLCSGDDNGPEIFDWVLRWLAYPIQHPGAKMKTALVFHGPQGAGKNLFFEAVMSIYGPYGRIVDQAAVEDKFNDWLSRKLFLIADEVVARAELYHVKNKLKGVITGDWIRINPKNVAAHDERNHVNLVFLSNEKQPLVLDEDDRRYVVVWTPPTLPPAFAADVAAELRAGGAAALHGHLRELELGDFGPHSKPPQTEARRDLIELGRDSVGIFIRDWEAGETVYPIVPAGSGDFYTAYARHCRACGEPRPRTHNQFSGDLRKRPGWTVEPRHIFDNPECYGKPAPRRVVIPPVALLQRANSAQPAGESTSNWLTRSFFRFREALKVASF